MFRCIPDPATPYTGLGMKVACRPFFWARVFTASFRVMILSAPSKASTYLKSISCWPMAHSWWLASISNFMASSARQISRRVLSPWSRGPRSK